jgi:hypothetical protein
MNNNEYNNNKQKYLDLKKLLGGGYNLTEDELKELDKTIISTITSVPSINCAIS